MRPSRNGSGRARLVCPKCGGAEHCVVGPSRLYQCNACRRQTSADGGHVFASNKVALTTWFRAMYLITQTKQGISSIELGRRLGVMQTTAWKIKTKLVKAIPALAAWLFEARQCGATHARRCVPARPLRDHREKGVREQI